MNELNCHENVIEWLNGQDEATFTFSQKRMINKMERFAKKYPQNCTILKRNSDGSITGHIRTRAVTFSQMALKNIGEIADTEDEDECGE